MKKNYDKDWEEKTLQLNYEDILLDKKRSKSNIVIRKVAKAY